MSSAELLPLVLEPLLEDFRYWFERSHHLLSNNRIHFLSEADQADLLHRIEEAQQAIAVSTTMFNLSDKKVGIDPQLVVNWHRLLMECQAVGMRYRQQ
jgi:hypothetical protein